MMNLNEKVNFTQKKETPLSSKLVDDQSGDLHLGWFARPFSNPNVLEALKKSPTGAISPFAPLREKRWQFFSFTSKKYIVGMASAYTGYLSNFFLYAFNIETKKYHQFQHILPIFKAAKIPLNALTEVMTYEGAGNKLKVESHLDQNPGYHLVTFHCQDRKNHILSGSVKVYAEGEPLVNSREVSPRRIVYTHQNSMNRPEGQVQWDDETIHFDPQLSFSSMDFTVGLPTYRTTWNWASAAGLSKDGTPIAINFAADIVDGTNDVVAFWIGKKLYRIPKMKFLYQDPLKTWRIESPEGDIQLDFQPISQRSENISVLGLIESKFIQPFGYYSGSVSLPSGKKYIVENMLGIAEEHFAKW